MTSGAIGWGSPLPPRPVALTGRYIGADATRLSPAALETLAIVAYRQPLTKGGVERTAGRLRLHTCGRCSIAGSSSSWAARRRPVGRTLYGTDFEFL